ncbi:unnamed protein product [Mytilus edulis]|uniref:Fibronectin type-III domain-containing protein n=1 Tax=Mytilus edulis TaxID=6550 RepID=A0A8S3Q565_MYTED|nr:unnamed protein product [Mytilus edulis]
MLATGHTDPPTDVRIDIIDNTAIISWMIPSNQAVMWSRIQLNDSKDDNVFLDSRKPYKDIPFPYSSFEIANLKMCSEYYVGVKFIGQDGSSECTIQTFWMTTTPENPVLTIDHKHPFVNDNITFTCTATVQRWPRYIPSNISYQFFGIPRGYINNNTLILNKLTKSDKDIAISCQATDDLGKVSNMSESIILDPYYGPDNVLVKPEYTVINVTEGTVLGPIHCTADCNPKYSSQIRRTVAVDNIKINEWSNAKIYSFNEVVNLKIKLSIESNPDPQLVLSTPLRTFPPLRYTKKGIEFLSELPALRCEDSGNYTIQAFNGIKNGDSRTVNLIIYCKYSDRKIYLEV